MGMLLVWPNTRMPRKYLMPRPADKTDLMQGTLDMLVLRTLRGGQLHGYAVANKIQAQSEGFLQVEEGSLYPALHRMEKRGWITAEWGLSENKRRAKYYELTAAGRDQLKTKAKTWNMLVEAISGVMGTRTAQS
jgi:PadR family transcriptional regulator